MSNLSLVLYVMDSLNICNTLRKETDDYWVIETEKKVFWFHADGSFYETITEDLELE